MGTIQGWVWELWVWLWSQDGQEKPIEWLWVPLRMVGWVGCQQARMALGDGGRVWEGRYPV